MGIISLLIKAFLLYLFFTFVMAAWRIFRTFKVLKSQHGQASDFFKQQSQQGQSHYNGSSSQNHDRPMGDVFDAEYRVVKEEN